MLLEQFLELSREILLDLLHVPGLPVEKAWVTWWHVSSSELQAQTHQWEISGTAVLPAVKQVVLF